MLALPEYIEIESDEEETEMFRQMARSKGYKKKQYKKEKSLGVLCQQFIYLFNVWKRVFSLEAASKKIMISEQASLPKG